jgi:hypothetical protein
MMVAVGVIEGGGVDVCEGIIVGVEDGSTVALEPSQAESAIKPRRIPRRINSQGKSRFDEWCSGLACLGLMITYPGLIS